MESDSEEEGLTNERDGGIPSTYEVIPPINITEVEVNKVKETGRQRKFNVLPPIASKMETQQSLSTLEMLQHAAATPNLIPHPPSIKKLIPHPPSTPKMVPHPPSTPKMVPHPPLTPKMVPHPPAAPKSTNTRRRLLSKKSIGISVLPQISKENGSADADVTESVDVKVTKSKGDMNIHSRLPAIKQKIRVERSGLNGGYSRSCSIAENMLVRNMRGKVTELEHGLVKNNVDKQGLFGLTTSNILGEGTIPGYDDEVLLKFMDDLDRVNSDSSIESNADEFVMNHEKYINEEVGGTRATNRCQSPIALKGLQLSNGEKIVIGKFISASPTRLKQDHWKLGLNESGYNSIFTSFGAGRSAEVAKTTDTGERKLEGGETDVEASCSGSNFSIDSVEP